MTITASSGPYRQRCDFLCETSASSTCVVAVLSTWEKTVGLRRGAVVGDVLIPACPTGARIRRHGILITMGPTGTGRSRCPATSTHAAGK